MLKKTITYDTFDGKKVTDTLYFNLTKAEMVAWEMSTNEGLTDYFIRIANANDRPTLLKAFEDLLMMTVGEKSEDGKHFHKSAEISKRFKDSAAYDAFFMEFFMNEGAAVDFIRGVIPADLVNDETIAEVMKTGDERLAAVASQLQPPPPPTYPAGGMGHSPNPAGM